MNAGDTKPLWFRERMFGYGYGPSSWQGWLVTAIFLLVFIGTGKAATYLLPLHHLSHGWYLAVIALFVAEIGVFLKIFYTHCGPA